MDRFWEMFRESIIVQSIITVAVVLTVLYLYATGQEVPIGLGQLGTLVMGFWFGTKSQYVVESYVRKMGEKDIDREE